MHVPSGLDTTLIQDRETMSANTPTTPTVLVVDDDPAVTGFIAEALTREGYRVVTTVGAQTLHLAVTLHPDVVLLDILMPGMDGIEVSQGLRANPATAEIPIVAISGDPVRIHSLLMPVNDQLSKPIALEDLLSVVARWAKLATFL
jgi:CheY-like chemotaxis protein